MKRLAVALLLLPSLALAQSNPGFSGSSEGNNNPLTATQLNNAFAIKQDYNQPGLFTGLTVNGLSNFNGGFEVNGYAIAWPGVAGTVDLIAASQTLTNKTISGAANTLSNVPNSALVNSGITVNGVNISLGGSGTITASAGSVTINSTGVTGGTAGDLLDISGGAISQIAPSSLSIGWGQLTGTPTTLGGYGITNGVTGGVNSNITSLTGLTTPLPFSEGGTSATTAAGALSALGAASAVSPNFTGTFQVGGYAMSWPTQAGTVDLVAAAQTLTNKTISGAANTLSNVPNSALVNSGITVNGVNISLGGSGTITASAGSVTINSTGVTGGTAGDLLDISGGAISQIAPSSLSIGWGQLTGTPTTLGGYGITDGATAGANSNITSLGGLTTPLPFSEGGTSATTAAGALSALGAASAVSPNFTGTFQVGGYAMSWPTQAGTVDLIAASQTLTNKTISGAANTLSNVPNSALVNSGITVNGVNISLGGSGTITASAGSVTINSTGVTGGTAGDLLDISGGVISQIAPSSLSIGWGQLTGTPTTLGGYGITNGVTGGANSNITSLTGLTTPLPFSEGGTSATTAAGALSALGAASAASPNFTGTFQVGGYAMSWPTQAGTVDLIAASQTLTNKTISGAANTLSNVSNSALVNSGITVNGTLWSLGGTYTIGTTGAITSVSNADSSLTVTPTTGAVVASLNPAHANTFTANEAFTAGSNAFYATNTGSPLIGGSPGIGQGAFAAHETSWTPPTTHSNAMGNPGLWSAYDETILDAVGLTNRTANVVDQWNAALIGLYIQGTASAALYNSHYVGVASYAEIPSGLADGMNGGTWAGGLPGNSSYLEAEAATFVAFTASSGDYVVAQENYVCDNPGCGGGTGYESRLTGVAALIYKDFAGADFGSSGFIADSLGTQQTTYAPNSILRGIGGWLVGLDFTGITNVPGFIAIALPDEVSIASDASNLYFYVNNVGVETLNTVDASFTVPLDYFGFLPTGTATSGACFNTTGTGSTAVSDLISCPLPGTFAGGTVAGVTTFSAPGTALVVDNYAQFDSTIYLSSQGAAGVGILGFNGTDIQFWMHNTQIADLSATAATFDVPIVYGNGIPTGTSAHNACFTAAGELIGC